MSRSKKTETEAEVTGDYLIVKTGKGHALVAPGEDADGVTVAAFSAEKEAKAHLKELEAE